MATSDDDPLAPTVEPDAARDPTLAAQATPTRDDSASLIVPPALVAVERAHYDVLSEFGRGGLGRVLRARDRRTGRIVAIKEALRPTPGLLARFAREALVTANLQHPSIVPVYEVGQWDHGEPFYAMKLVAGRSLAEAARAALTLRERLALLPHVIAIADALAYAHGERVIHRDLKPANVLLGDFGETVVIDWGLAKRLGDADDAPGDASGGGGGQTVAGSVLGTPGYMAPEQARGEPADERSDVYAIGALLYEVLGRARPYGETTEASEVLARAAVEPPAPLARLAGDVPRELVAIVERAMAFDPTARYPTARELADDLKRFQTGQLVGAHAYSLWMLIRRWVRRHRGVVVATAIALVVLAAVGALGVDRIRDARDRAVAAQAFAEDRAAALAEEQGRRLAVSGDAARALPYLAAAVEANRSSPALRFVLGRALDQIAPLETVLFSGHMPATSAAYSPDGRRLVTAGHDLAIRMWDPRTRTPLGTIGQGSHVAWSPDGTFLATFAPLGGVSILDPTGAVRASWALDGAPVALEISRDSALVAAGTSTGRVMAWRPGGSDPVVNARPHAGRVVAIAIAPDGAHVASAGEDRRAAIAAAGGGAPRVIEHPARVLAIAYAPDGTRLATGDGDGNAVIWDARTGARVAACEGHTNSVEAVGFDPAGARLVTGSADRTVAICDARTGTRLAAMAAGAGVLEARFLPDGATVVARTDHGELHLWSEQGDRRATLAGHVGSVTSLAVSPDGAQLASTGLDGDVRLWRATTPPAVISLATAGSAAWRGAFAPDGHALAVTSKDGRGRVFDAKTGALAHELTGHAGEITRVAFSPDGASLATASIDGTVKLWSVRSGALARTLDAGAGRARHVAFSHDGTRLATTHDDGAARIWDASSGATLAELRPARGKPRTALWSPDDRRVLTPLDGPGATLWSAEGKRLGEAEMPVAMAIAAQWSSDGDRFVLGGTIATAQVHDGLTAAPREQLAGHTIGPITTAAFAPDGTIYTTGAEGIVRRWRAGTLRTLFGDGRYATNAAVRGDGALIATVDIDVRIWDVASGEVVGVLPGPRDVENAALTEAHWSPDGSQLLVLSLAGPPKLWRIPEWNGSSEQLAARLRCTARWRLGYSSLVLATPDPASCR